MGIAVVEKPMYSIWKEGNSRYELSSFPGDLFHARFRIIFVFVNGPKIEKAWQ